MELWVGGTFLGDSMKKLPILFFFITLFSMPLYAQGTVILDGFVTQYLPPSIMSVPERPGQRLFEVYLPEGYDPAGTTRYPVVYFLHGLGGDYASFPGLQFLMDEAIAAGIIVPMIVIKVDGSCTPLVSGGVITGSGLNGFWYVNAFAQDGTPLTEQQYEEYLFQPDGLLAYVDAHYNTRASQPYRACMGQSMGGYGSLWLGINHPDKISAFCSDSGTPPWVLYTDLANSNTMLFCNTVLTETVSNVPPSTLIQPGSRSSKFFTNTVYSNVNGWSVLSTDTSDYPYDVTLPFLVTSTQLPASGVLDGTGSLISNTLTLARIAEHDPYNYIVSQAATLGKQTVYFDAAAQELINGVGASFFSNKLIDNLIDHEYLLVQGGHTTCLTDQECSRFLTNLQRISASLAAGGLYADDIRAKVQGIMAITLADNAQLVVPQGTILGIETSNENNNVTVTDITLTLNDNAQVIIGTDTVPGGALQIGDRTTKARINGMSSLATHTINFTLNLNGPGTLVEVGSQGFLGFGVGVDGQMPAQPNFWGVSSLINVKNIVINGVQGTLKHTHIASGDQDNASLIAFGSAESVALINCPTDPEQINTGTSIAYTWQFDPHNTSILGGGNIVEIVDGLVMHPTILTTTGSAPVVGARTIMNTCTYALDSFYNQNQASKTYYTNQLATDILASDITLQDLTKVAQLPLQGVPVTQLFGYLALIDYYDQGTKSTDISTFVTPDETGYVDQTIIQRAPMATLIPIPPVTLARIQARAGAGIKLVTRDGTRQILRMYDLNPPA